ncbi:class I SAM-dependent DNA methyltransferase [Nakamurella lactea]|uniref:class I SAM-dependent DNA methyltransferase n=1 Tax=Nakamurella lactea TaxID=459515 RepID=UPI0003FB931A|nr:class I SAM-dependent methyltransferase [Nakamurella lactea]
MPDPIFSDRRLAEIYDPMDPDRSDLDAYAAMVDEFGAGSVLDVGCGTGTFACLLAARGVEVIGVDPAGASLDVARTKPGADLVRWIDGDATTLPSLQVDLATMTANVAQVFVTDESWAATLQGIRAALKPQGRVVFEVRDPARRAWQEWDREHTHETKDVPGVGPVETWCDLTDVSGQLVSFRWTNIFHADGATIISDSTLRFRTRQEIEQSLRDNGFTVDVVRDAPDRPRRELVFVATRES